MPPSKLCKIFTDVQVAMEYMSAGSLYDIIKLYQEGICFSESDICFAIHEVLVAIEYLHSLRRIHRDMKGRQIFFVLLTTR